jgi:hypothetical protein
MGVFANTPLCLHQVLDYANDPSCGAVANGRLAGPPTRVAPDTRTRTKPWIVRVRPPLRDHPQA